jgi:hypothetical protein
MMRAELTDYDTGTGFWLGHDGTNPKFSIGDSSGDKFTFDGSIISGEGEFKFNQAVEFTPGWSGFSSNPGGTALALDLGALFLIWPASYTDSFAGTSNANTFVMTNVPAPAFMPISASTSCIGQAFDSLGNTIAQAILQYSSGWQVRFDAQSITSSKLNFSSTGWATSGSKGWNGHLMFATQRDPK